MTTYRSIVKDGYTTRDPQESNVEVMAWKVDRDVELSRQPPREGVEDPIKTASGNLRYDKILDDALDEIGADEISRRTGLKSYRDDRGGRAESTVRGYQYKDGWGEPKDDGGLPSSHPVKRVLRRYARSQDKGHFEEDEAGDEQLALDARPARTIPGTIDMDALKRAFKLARSICSQNGIVFVDRDGNPSAVEDNERIDSDEVRPADRPIGETKAACQVEKNGSIYEYEIDLDNKDLIRDGDMPPEGF